MPVCNPLPQPEGCLSPCEDVHLCAIVRRGRFDDDLVPVPTNEFSYVVTLENCSSATLIGDFHIVLGEGLQCDASNPTVPGPTGTFTGFEACPEVGFNQNPAWTGVSPNTVLFTEKVHVPPGSYQFWYRFTTLANDDISYLPSTVRFVGTVHDPVCKYPCLIDKCIHVNGDCLVML